MLAAVRTCSHTVVVSVAAAALQAPPTTPEDRYRRWTALALCANWSPGIRVGALASVLQARSARLQATAGPV